MSNPRTPMYNDWPEQVLVYLAADPTTLSQLPTEVWERVLDKLDLTYWVNYDMRRRTFVACCLVCRAWVPRSRYHLFQYLQIRSKEQTKKVSKMLHSIPALRTRVEELSVIGSKDGKKDASWIDLVGFHLGPKLKALKRIEIRKVDFSLAGLEFYKFWGTFNRSWRPDAAQELNFQSCTVTHLNQLMRLALVTKARELFIIFLKSPGEKTETTPPIPNLPSGISPPLRKLYILQILTDLALSMEWPGLGQRCPSLSEVRISHSREFLDPSFPGARLHLASILGMFRFMQRNNDTSDVTLAAFTFMLFIHMNTRPRPRSGDASSALVTPPHLHRGLYLHNMKKVEALTLVEEAMALGENRRFNHVQITCSPSYRLRPSSCQLLDSILSRLRVITPDVHMAIKESNRPHKSCVLPWASEHFPNFTQLAPSAFCDPEAGRLCRSHLEKAGDDERTQQKEEGEIVGVAAERGVRLQRQRGSGTRKPWR